MIFLLIVLPSLLAGNPAAVEAAEDSRLRQFFETTPIFGQPVTLTEAEFAVAEQWPITKVLLMKDSRSRLVLFRSEIAAGKTAAFFHWVAPEAGWEQEFAFGMREIGDAYWATETAPPSLVEKHRIPPAEAILKATQGALTRGYLRQGLETPWLVLEYTDGKSLKRTEIAYPLIQFETVADGQGFVAAVGPPVIAPAPEKIRQSK
jgi:hypothetical protein